MGPEGEAGLAGLAVDLPALQGEFVLQPVTRRQPLVDGWMNQSWRITAGQDQYVLKQIRDASAAAARSTFAALSFLKTRAIPVCVPVRSAAGDTVVEVDGRSYSLVPWVDGIHQTGTGLSLQGVKELGRLVGRIHQALADLPAECGLPPVPGALEVEVADPEEAERLMATISGIVAGISVPTSYDVTVRDLLERRLELLGEYGHLRPGTTVPVGPFGRVHGDINARNLLFQGDDVVAVLDWDRMRVRPYAAEVVQAGLGFFGSESGALDLRMISAFTVAYRAVMPVSAAALADAVSRLLWKRLTDVWPLEFRYVRGDPSERIAGLFPPAERALQWWAGNLDDVAGAFTG